jgi:Tol biopolymer transport system component
MIRMRKFRLFILTISVAMAVVLAAAQKDPRAEAQLQAAINKETVEGDLKSAIEMYRKVAQSGNRAVAAKALVRMGQCYDKMGDAEARKAYERVVRDFADQKEAVEDARRLLGAKPAPAGTGVTARQIWAGGNDRYYGPAVSRDGRYIAYIDRSKVVVHDLSTGDEKLLVGAPGLGFNNALISPDGKQVAYAEWLSAGSMVELYVSSIDGSNRRLLVGGKGILASPWSWSPDGKQILAHFWSKEDGRNTALVSVADGSRTLMKWMDYPRLSPDGRYIAFVKSRDSESGIFLQPVGGGDEIPLVEIAGRNRFPMWAPDGKRLLFVSDRRGSHEFWSIGVVDGKPAGPPDLLRGATVQFRVASPDHLLDVSPGGDCYYQLTKLARDLYVADIDPETGKLTGQPRRVPTAGLGAGAAWSPDGERLARYARRQQGDGKFTVVIHTVKTGEEHVLEPKSPIEPWGEEPQWFPDGQSFFVPSKDGRLRQLHVQTGELRELPGNVTLRYSQLGSFEYDTPVILAPDGRTVYYLARDPETHQTRILRRDLQGGPEQELCRPYPESITSLSISPDGARLAFMTESATGWELITLATSGGEPKEVCRGLNPQARRPVWSKDGRWVFFTRRTARGPDIMSVSAEGGEPQELGIGLHAQCFLDTHPDGKQILFVDEQWSNQLWVLKNLFGNAKASR